MLTKLLQAQGGAIRPNIFKERGNMSGNESCKEKHEYVIERLDRNEQRLNKHGEEIDELKEKQSAFDVRIEHLIKSIENLNKAMWWLIGLGGTTLVSFLMRQIEKSLMGG